MSTIRSARDSQEMAAPLEKTLLKPKSSLRLVRKKAARLTGLHGFLSGKARNSLLKTDSSVREAPKFEEETKEEPAKPLKVQPLLVKQGLPVEEDRKEPVVEPPVVHAAEGFDKPMEPAADDSPMKTPKFEDNGTKEELTDPSKLEPVPVEEDRKGPVVNHPTVVVVEERAADGKPAKTVSIKPPAEPAAHDKPVKTRVDRAVDDKPVKTSNLPTLKASDGESVDPIVVVLCNP